MPIELCARLKQFAERSVHVRSYCKSEESTKLYLILPFFELLGFDIKDPKICIPEFHADYSPTYQRKVDFAIFHDGVPALAIEAKCVGTDLTDARSQLRGYFGALQTVRIGVATNGTVFEFFSDYDHPNVMDDLPFLTLDIDEFATGSFRPDKLDVIAAMMQPHFNVETILASAVSVRIKERLAPELRVEFKSPSVEFCRMLLGRIGVTNVRATTIESHYQFVVAEALEMAIVTPVVEALQRRRDADPEQSTTNQEKPNRRSAEVTKTELAVFDYVRRRLSYLVKGEEAFCAVDELEYRDFIGKFVIYLDHSRKGRLLEHKLLDDGRHWFYFPELDKEHITSELAEIDPALLEAFTAKLRSRRSAA